MNAAPPSFAGSGRVSAVPSPGYELAVVERAVVAGGRRVRLRRRVKGGAEWFLVESGSVQFDWGGRQTLLAAGGVLMLSPEEAMPEVFTAGRLGWGGIRLGFVGERADGFMRYLVRRFGRLRTIALDSRPVRAAVALHQRLEAGAGLSPAGKSALVFAWLHAWLDFLEENTPPLRMLFELEPGDPRLAALSAQPLKAIAQDLGCSPSTLRRRLQVAWGQAPGEVMRRARLREAQRLLRAGGPALGEVGARTGYTTESAFIAAFRREFGVTPAVFRRRQTSELAAWPVPSLPIVAPSAPQVRSDAANPTQARAPHWNGPFFQPFHCGVTEEVKGEAFELSHAANRSACWVVTLRGRAVLEVGDQRLKVTPGMVVAYRMPLNGRWLTPAGTRWKRLWIQMRGDLAHDYLAYLTQHYGSVFRLDRAGRMRRAAEQLVEKVRTGEVRQPREWSQLAFGWLIECHRELERKRGMVRHRLILAGKESPLLSGEMRSMKEFAEKMGYSRAYLSRKLRAQWWNTPGYVLRTTRLEQAAWLLRTTRKPVREIATLALYRSQAAFINAFKKLHGRTPSAYRRDTAG